MRIEQDSVKDIAEAVRSSHPAEHELWLDLGHARAEVRCSTAALRDELADYFKEFTADPGKADFTITAHETEAPEPAVDLTVKEPDPGKTKIKEEYADLADGRMVRKRLTGMLFAFGGGTNVALGPCLQNANQVINFVNNRHIEMRLNAGDLLGHAAGVVHNGRGMSMAGFSGAGKSTLALHVMSRGADFVSNDRLMVESTANGLLMHGVAKQPRINPGTALNNSDLECIVTEEDRERFLTMPTEELWKLEHKYDALIDVCYGPDRFHLSTPMDAVVLLNWKLDGGATHIVEIDPMEREDLLPAFMKAPGLFYLPGKGRAAGMRSVEEYARTLQRCTVLEVSGGIDFDLAAEACMCFMETGSIA